MKIHGPWKTLETQTVHDTPWIRVDHSRVINPSGNPGAYSTIHFKNLAIGIVPIDNEGYIHLVGQYRYPIKTYSWEIPEGGGPLDIDPLDSAKRELKEECGITAANWEKISACHLSNSASDESCILYLATDLIQGEAEPEDDEQLANKRVSIQTFLSMVENHEITDSLTVLAAYKLEIMLLKKDPRLSHVLY